MKSKFALMCMFNFGIYPNIQFKLQTIIWCIGIRKPYQKIWHYYHLVTAHSHLLTENFHVQRIPIYATWSMAVYLLWNAIVHILKEVYLNWYKEHVTERLNKNESESMLAHRGWEQDTNRIEHMQIATMSFSIKLKFYHHSWLSSML